MEKSKLNSQTAGTNVKVTVDSSAELKKEEIKAVEADDKKAVKTANADVKAEKVEKNVADADVKAEKDAAVKAEKDAAVKADKDAEKDAKADKDADEDEIEYEEVEVEEESVDEKGVVTKVKTIKKVAKAKKEAPKKVAEPIYEPTSVFIDHGAILPEFLPGTHLFALIRDPGTLYTYWNSEIESANGWRVTAFDAQGNVLQSFVTTHKRGGRGYFHVETARVARVRLEMVGYAGQSEMVLESTIKILEQSHHRVEEKWVDFQDQTVVYEAPAPGQAPEYKAPVVSYDYAEDGTPIKRVVGGGGIEAMVSNAPQDLVPGMNPSSWFGPFRAPGSSDICVGASENCLRKK